MKRATWPEDSPESAQPAKLALTRTRSIPCGATRSSGSKREAVSVESQEKALKALAMKLAAKKSPEEIAKTICKPVVSHDGATAFPCGLQRMASSSLSAADAAIFGADAPQRGAWVSQEAKPDPKAIGVLMVRLLHILAAKTEMEFADVAGQILWHFRKSEVLSGDAALKCTAKDLSWVDFAAADPASKPSAMVSKAFLQHASEDGKLDERAFLKMMEQCLQVYAVKENGEIQYTGMRASIRRTDLNQLFFNQVHGNGQHSLSCTGLKSVLVKLAHNMHVHPASVFETVGGVGQSDKELLK